MEFILIASVHFLALLSPGPDFFLIMQASFRLPVRYCISICCGIAVANGLYLILAITGLSLISGIPFLAMAVKYLGAAYLLFVGVLLLRAPMRGLEGKGGSSYIHQKSYVRQFTLGFLSGILNPKNAIFYLAIFSVMVSAQTPLATRVLYGCWMALVVFVWDSFVVYIFSRKIIKNKLGEGLHYIEKVSGVVLVVLGVYLTCS